MIKISRPGKQPNSVRLRTGYRRRGLRIARHQATTRHAAALYPFQLDAGLGPDGIYIGENVTAGGEPWCFDPFQLYTTKTITSPNMLMLGSIGSGKSAAIKTMLYRSIGQLRSTSDGTPRWVAIIDPKGEYGPIADALGLDTITLKPGGTTRLDLLGAPNAAATLTAIATTALGHPATPLEEAAISWACQPGTPTPTLDRFIEHLAEPPPALHATVLGITQDTARHELRTLRYALAKFTTGALRGMFNGTASVDLNRNQRGVVIDLRSVHTDPNLLAIVMLATMSALHAHFAHTDGRKRVVVLEEAWAVFQLEAVARLYQSWQKLSRDLGVANIAVAHRTTDLTAQAADGTATAKIGQGIIADTQTQILFRLPPDQIPQTQRLLGLTAAEAKALPLLPIGRALWRVGTTSALVQHRIAASEEAICTTDAALSIQ